VASSSQTPYLVEEETAILNTHLGKNKNLGHEYQQESKPRIIVLARANSNLTD
jgi:hypothetical protein